MAWALSLGRLKQLTAVVGAYLATIFALSCIALFTLRQCEASLWFGPVPVCSLGPHTNSQVWSMFGSTQARVSYIMDQRLAPSLASCHPDEMVREETGQVRPLVYSVPPSVFPSEGVYNIAVFSSKNSRLSMNISLLDDREQPLRETHFSNKEYVLGTAGGQSWTDYFTFSTGEEPIDSSAPTESEEELRMRRTASVDGGDEDNVGSGSLEEVNRPIRGASRRLMKGGSYSSSPSSPPRRVRWGSGARYGSVKPIRTAYGWHGSSPTAVDTVIMAQPHDGSANLCGDSGCKMSVRTYLQRDEILHLSVDSGQLSAPIRIVVRDLNLSLAEGRVHPEVFFTFASESCDEEFEEYHFFRAVWSFISGLVLLALWFFFKMRSGSPRVVPKRTIPSWIHRGFADEEVVNIANGSFSTLSRIECDPRGVTFLDASDNDIVSMRGLDEFQRLRYLDLRNNDLKDLRGLEEVSTSIEAIDLSSNDIVSLALDDMRPLQNLEMFDLGNNDILCLPNMNWCQNVVWVNLANNDISHVFDIAACFPNLKWLNLADNNLRLLTGVSGCQSLSHLNVWSNDLGNAEDIVNECRNLTRLKTVVIGDNDFTSSQLQRIRSELVHINVMDSGYQEFEPADTEDADDTGNAYLRRRRHPQI